MIIKFPDGVAVDTTLQSLTPQMSSSAPVLFFTLPNGSTYTAYSFVFTTAIGQIEGINKIYLAYAVGENFVELYSDAGLPTGGNTLVTDMFPNASATPASINGGDKVYLVIGTTWPPTVGSALPASFQPDAAVTIGGEPVLNLTYINGVTLTFQTPPLATGTYDLVYTDSRGSVTKPGALTFL